MANREELSVIRGARAGRAESQLALGRLYLFGSAGLPKSLPTALHWLDRAAQQGCVEAWQLIGNHIPVDLARSNAAPVTSWYERAYDGGLVRAGLVYAQLILNEDEPGNASGMAPSAADRRAKALRALEDAAGAGFAEAQWMLAREHGAALPDPAPAAHTGPAGAAPFGSSGQRWLRQAADSGVGAAQFALLDQDWEHGRWPAYLARGLPLARALAASDAAQDHAAARLAPDEVLLLSRCARLVETDATAHDVTQDELQHFWELAASEQDRHAQLALGLWCARMRIDGKRSPAGIGAANFKKAVRWLSQAGEGGWPRRGTRWRGSISSRNFRNAMSWKRRSIWSAPPRWATAMPSSNAATRPGARAAKTKTTMCVRCSGCKRPRPRGVAKRVRSCASWRHASRMPGPNWPRRARQAIWRRIRCWRRGWNWRRRSA
jgi:TPR repeat protein